MASQPRLPKLLFLEGQDIHTNPGKSQLVTLPIAVFLELLSSILTLEILFTFLLFYLVFFPRSHETLVFLLFLHLLVYSHCSTFMWSRFEYSCFLRTDAWESQLLDTSRVFSLQTRDAGPNITEI